RKYPHNTTESADPIRLLVQDEVSLNAGTALPTRSWIMNRSTRVPASTVVRMNSASNRIAKWYQIPMTVWPPRKDDRMLAMPTASVGAPPARQWLRLPLPPWPLCGLCGGAPPPPKTESAGGGGGGGAPTPPPELFTAKKTRGWTPPPPITPMRATNASISTPPYPMNA